MASAPGTATAALATCTCHCHHYPLHHPSVASHAPVGLPLAVSTAPSSSVDPLCRDCWPNCRRRARTCSWTRAARSLSASGPSAPRRSSCRSEGSAREQTPVSGCRADSRKLPSCIVTGATSHPTCPGPLPGLVPQGPVPEVSSWLALLDRRPPSPELGWGRGHLGQVGGRGLCLLKVEFGRKNRPSASSSHGPAFSLVLSQNGATVTWVLLALSLPSPDQAPRVPAL